MMRKLAAMALAAAFWNQAATAQSSTVFSFDSMLKVSRWQTRLGDLQSRLNEELLACGKLGLTADRRLGRDTRAAIARLRTCDGFKFPGEDGSEILSEALWQKLWPGESLPTLSQRVGVLVFHFESTDYDSFLWNVGQAADPIAFGTWGPFGATLGAGGEIQTIMKAVEAASPGLVKRAFADANPTPASPPSTSWRISYCTTAARPAPALSGADLLLSLSAPLSNADKDRLRDEFCADDRYLLWYSAFRSLAAEPAVRQAFDDHYARQNRSGVARLAAVYAERGWTPTEIDWAYFLDRTTQYTGGMDAVARDLAAAPANATPAQRRLIASRAARPTQEVQRRLRVGRDMAFVIDGVAESDLTSEELVAWRNYGAIRARQAGLSDARTLAQSPF